MKFTEVKKKTKDELNDLLESLKKENYNLRFQKKNGQLEKTGRIKEVKKDIARVKTKLNEENKGGKDAKKNIER
ncbi:MAG: 50S ribosomal protein L29 [Pelagibacteraceae bacterium]|nr:50S ribosomal protein L29 [Pelagibacteraceae bacterium]|tara:strand:+ start:16171 stop:16392 length:222 start_codon:yes stop_codon:yes gene_type:complete